MPASKNDRRLKEIATQLRSAHDSVVSNKVEAGRLLVEARTLVKGGQWSKWLTDNFPGSAATARRWMQLYEGQQAGAIQGDESTQAEALDKLKHDSPRLEGAETQAGASPADGSAGGQPNSNAPPAPADESQTSKAIAYRKLHRNLTGALRAAPREDWKELIQKVRDWCDLMEQGSATDSYSPGTPENRSGPSQRNPLPRLSTRRDAPSATRNNRVRLA